MGKKIERKSFLKGRRMKRCMVQKNPLLVGKVRKDHMKVERLIQGLVPGKRARKMILKVAIGQVPAKVSRRRNIPAGRMKNMSRNKKVIEQKKT